eukprot:3936267-Rhodomonas_salina.2
MIGQLLLLAHVTVIPRKVAAELVGRIEGTWISSVSDDDYLKVGCCCCCFGAVVDGGGVGDDDGMG